MNCYLETTRDSILGVNLLTPSGFVQRGTVMARPYLRKVDLLKKEIADYLGIHYSTVSKIISNSNKRKQ